MQCTSTYVLKLNVHTLRFHALLSGLKTDLRLLLECLKFQMKSPDLQKQSLLTIHSICEKRGKACQMLVIYCNHRTSHIFDALIFDLRPLECCKHIQSLFIPTEDTVDILRELGGVTFIQNLSKSSVVHEDVKEAALFTLGTVAEANGAYRCF